MMTDITSSCNGAPRAASEGTNTSDWIIPRLTCSSLFI